MRKLASILVFGLAFSTVRVCADSLPLSGAIERGELLGLPNYLQQPTGIWNLWNGDQKAYSIFLYIIPTSGIELSRVVIMSVGPDRWSMSSFLTLQYRVSRVDMAQDEDGKGNYVSFLNQQGKVVAAVRLPGESLELRFQKK